MSNFVRIPKERNYNRSFEGESVYSKSLLFFNETDVSWKDLLLVGETVLFWMFFCCCRPCRRHVVTTVDFRIPFFLSTTPFFYSDICKVSPFRGDRECDVRRWLMREFSSYVQNVLHLVN